MTKFTNQEDTADYSDEETINETPSIGAKESAAATALVSVFNTDGHRNRSALESMYSAIDKEEKEQQRRIKEEKRRERQCLPEHERAPKPKTKPIKKRKTSASVTAATITQKPIKVGDYIKIYWEDDKTWFGCRVLELINDQNIRVFYDCDNTCETETISGMSYRHVHNKAIADIIDYTDHELNKTYTLFPSGKVIIVSNKPQAATANSNVPPIPVTINNESDVLGDDLDQELTQQLAEIETKKRELAELESKTIALKVAKRQKLHKQEVRTAADEIEVALTTRPDLANTLDAAIAEWEQSQIAVSKAKAKLQEKVGEQSIADFFGKNKDYFSPTFANTVVTQQQRVLAFSSICKDLSTSLADEAAKMLIELQPKSTTTSSSSPAASPKPETL